MTTILHIDASARSGRSDLHSYGAHSRRLAARFVERWRKWRAQDAILHRDVGQAPPRPVNGDWIHAAFTPPQQRARWMDQALAESDRLVDELIAADVILVAAPMYNFGPPAQLKAWIDNIVRVGRTFGFDRDRAGAPYWPMLSEMSKTLVTLCAAGDVGYGPGEAQAARNHLEQSIATPLAYLGIARHLAVRVEGDEFGGATLADSMVEAEAEVDALVDRLNA